MGGYRRPHRRHHEAGNRLDRGQAVRLQRRDVQGSLTGLAGYLQGVVGTRGSTLEQQYVKNFNLLVVPKRRGAAGGIEPTPTRKLREIRMALELDKALSKPEILTRYLNLVSFGNGSYGVQEAARTYFGVNAADLNWQQAALLAGMVQSTSALNPFTNPKVFWRDGISCSTP